ncbi:MAG: VOC family protein [Thermomicrobiales bacterium]
MLATLLTMTDVTFAYTIITVADVPATIGFYEQAFGFQRRFVSDDGDYGELDTGAVTLSFASESLTGTNLAGGFQAHRPEELPFGYEIALATSDVPGAIARAIDAGGSLVAEPKQKPWGQLVGYVRDPNGVLIEVCTPMSS